MKRYVCPNCLSEYHEEPALCPICLYSVDEQGPMFDRDRPDLKPIRALVVVNEDHEAAVYCDHPLELLLAEWLAKKSVIATEQDMLDFGPLGLCRIQRRNGMLFDRGLWKTYAKKIKQAAKHRFDKPV